MTLAATERVIESFYDPAQLVTASPGRRLGGYVLDVLFQAVTFFIGWLIWFAIVAPRGQTPGKQLLGMYIVREDGTRAGGGYTWLRELVIKGIVFAVVSAVVSVAAQAPVGSLLWVIAALWCLWDRNTQCLWDKIGRTYVAHAPLGFRPLTATERLYDTASQPSRTESARAAPDLSVEQQAPASEVGQRLRELKQLLDDDVITESEYEERRTRLIEDL